MMNEYVPKGQRILITGGGGFIGSHLVDALIDTNEVRVLDDFSTGFRNQVAPGATVFEGDIRDEAVLTRAMDGVDIVFHEAAMVSVPKTVANPLASEAVNAMGTVQLLERARRESARVVCASSAAIYGQPERVPISEDDRLKPTSPYGIQKLTLDHYTRLYNDLYDLDTVTLRYFNVYGPRAEAGEYSDVVSVFVRQARAGDPITIEGSGQQTRDFVHVDDVVQANCLAATTDATGEAYNIGSGAETTITELSTLVKEQMRSESPIEHVDPRPGDIDESVSDISKARRKLGYEPSFNIESGLKTLRQIRERN